MNEKKLIVFGGSFNPVHNGHIKLAVEAQRYIDADKVIVIPTNVSPHKKCNLADSFHRFNMCKVAFNKFDGIEVSDLEIKRGGISYTIDTLNQIKKMYKNFEIFLLVGSDMFLSLTSWKDADKIFKISNICVACRDTLEHEKVVDHSKLLKSKGAKVLIMEFSPVEISSSEIRHKIKSDENIKGLVPDGVADYIKKNKLYF